MYGATLTGLAEADGVIADPAPCHRGHRLGIPVDLPGLLAAEMPQHHAFADGAVGSDRLAVLRCRLVSFQPPHFPCPLESSERILDRLLADAVSDYELIVKVGQRGTIEHVDDAFRAVGSPLLPALSGFDVD